MCDLCAARVHTALRAFTLAQADKWAILNVYMKPPLYGHDLFDNFEEICFCMLTGKAVFATHFYAVAGGIEPDISATWDYTRAHVLPMLFVSVVCVLVISAVNTRRFYLYCTPCGKQEKLRKKAELLKKVQVQNPEEISLNNAIDRDEVLPTFSEALEKDLIVNESDDYEMNEHEVIGSLQETFMAHIRKGKALG